MRAGTAECNYGEIVHRCTIFCVSFPPTFQAGAIVSFFLRALLQVPAREKKKARTCFDRWRCSGVKHSWILVIRDRTVDGASERHRQSSQRQRQPPWKANGKGSERTDRRGDEREREREREIYEGESKTDWGARENKIQGANGPAFRLHTPTHLALTGICNCQSGQCVSPVPVARGAELKHWQAKAARRYLLSEIESARRTEPCWHVSSRPCQPYLIVPIATCRTIIPDNTGCGTESVSSHPHRTGACESHGSIRRFNRTYPRR